MFVLQAGHGVVMLSEQYRMHPAISAWPSRFFYESKLLDGPELRDGTLRKAPWHSRPCFPPIAFFDCQCAFFIARLLPIHSQDLLVCSLRVLHSNWSSIVLVGLQKSDTAVFRRPDVCRHRQQLQAKFLASRHAHVCLRPALCHFALLSPIHLGQVFQRLCVVPDAEEDLQSVSNARVCAA